MKLIESDRIENRTKKTPNGRQTNRESSISGQDNRALLFELLLLNYITVSPALQ